MFFRLMIGDSETLGSGRYFWMYCAQKTGESGTEGSRLDILGEDPL